MAFEAHLIALDPALAEDFLRATGEGRGAVRMHAPSPDLAALGESAHPRIVIAVGDVATLDPAWWRSLQARAPQAQLLLVCRTCSDEAWRRWILLGALAVLRAPFASLDLETEFASEPAVTNVFRRHPTLAAHGKSMFRYRFPSDPQFIPGVVHMVSLLAMEFGFAPAEWGMNVPLAVDEAVSNAIIHGNRRDVRKQVEVEGQIDAQALRVKVRDEGDGFQRDPGHDPVRPENLLAASGRGIFLIESVMDEVRFTQDGRCIEMVKRARAPEGRPGTKPS
jgi:serine/threonine-protein kinase RsbW